jgi:hypothetical protein
VSEHFVEDSVVDGVQFASFSSEFKKLMMPKVEYTHWNNSPIEYLDLGISAPNGLVYEEAMRGEINVDCSTSLWQVFSLLKMQGAGQPGVLNVADGGTIFAVRDVEENLHMGSVYWRQKGGWSLHAEPIWKEWALEEAAGTRILRFPRK